MTPQITNDPDRAEDILRELMEICRKRKCVLQAGHGVFYLARMGDAPIEVIKAGALLGVQPEAKAIAQIREINPTMAEWAGTGDETKVTH